MSAARAHDPPDADPTAPPRGVRPIGDEDVALLRWPEEADVRHALSAAGQPRLLVVAADAPPPLVWDDREDCVRDDAGSVEIATRTARLAQMVSGPPPRPPLPLLDADGVLHGGDGRLAIIPPIEAALLARLLDQAGQVVHREELHRVGWPSGGRVRDLRRRIVGMGVSIHTVRGLGYLLEAQSPP